MLLVNATDLDASREFGQASLIYSLEGSSKFRLNSRSGLFPHGQVFGCVFTCQVCLGMFGPSKNFPFAGFLGVVAEILVFILEKKPISAYLDMSVVFFSPSSTL